jgi:predicted phage replisome organizer
MANVSWIKLNVNMFNDDKIRLIETMPEGDAILVVWIKLLTQAGKTNANGYIFLNENIPFNAEMLATLFNKPIATIRLALQTFQSFGMVEVDEREFISISNWEKHQNIDGMEKIKEQNRLRNIEYRQRKKQKLLTNDITRDVTVTQSDATDIDKELDKDKEKDIKKDISALENAFNEFWKAYPRKLDKKKAFEKFKSASKKHDPQIIIKGAADYAKECELKGTDKQFIKHATTFLNAESFLNDFDTTYSSGGQARTGGNKNSGANREDYEKWAQQHDIPF